MNISDKVMPHNKSVQRPEIVKSGVKK